MIGWNSPSHVYVIMTEPSAEAPLVTIRFVQAFAWLGCADAAAAVRSASAAKTYFLAPSLLIKPKEGDAGSLRETVIAIIRFLSFK
jgi:hypothetical protein